MSNEAADLARTPPFAIGNLHIEPSQRLVRSSDGQTSKLEPRVMQVLVALHDAGGATLNRDDLRRACWGGRITSDDAIDRVIAQIRRLGDGQGAGSFRVETIPKVGYRLVEEETAPEEALPFEAPKVSRRALLGGTGIAVLAAGSIALYRLTGSRKQAAREGPLTIAVLPFTTESASSEVADFAAALSDEVRSDLSRVTDIRVIAQISSRKAAGEGRTAQQIGDSLAADYLVEGQVGHNAANLVTRIALIDVLTGSEVWTAQETAQIGDPTNLRSAIAGDVIQYLAGIIPISSRQSTPITRPDPQAYAMVQKARRLIEDSRTSEMRGQRGKALSLGAEAGRLATQALSIDPNDGGALAVLATITRNGWTPELVQQGLTTKQRVQASVAIIRRALLADPSNPATLTELGDYYRRFQFRWDEAENLFRRALTIDPSSVDAHWSYAYQLGTLGRALEGLDHALWVFELDPINPFRRIALPRLLYLAGDRPSAMKLYDAELKQQPDNLFLLRELYLMFISEGNAGALQGLSGRIANGWPGGTLPPPEVANLMRRIDAGRSALLGRSQELRRLIDADVKSYDDPNAANDATPQGRARDDLPYIFAIEYAWSGQADKAIELLDRALSAKSLYWPPSLPFGIAQFPSAVRRIPRFQALWQRDPGLTELVNRRRTAVLSRQMAGFTPDGARAIPIIPANLQRRVANALRSHI